MKYYVLKFEDNYADEFDVSGIILTTENELNEFNDAIKWLKENWIPKGENKYRGEIEVYFGTNEFLKYRDWKQVRNSFKEFEVSESVYLEMMEIFQSFHFGESGVYWHVIDSYEAGKNSYEYCEYNFKQA